MVGPDPHTEHGETVRASPGWLMIPGLVVGHSVFHWIAQSFVVVLPEIQQAFNLSSVAVGGILSARELASGLVKIPAGVASDALARYWRWLLAACLVAGGSGALVIGVSNSYAPIVAGMIIVTIAHSVWHMPASASLSHHFRLRRGMALSFHGIGGGVGDALGPIATGALLLIMTWRELLTAYSLAAFGLGAISIWAYSHTGRTPTPHGPAVGQRMELTSRLVKNPVLWRLALVYGLRAMALVALVTILPLYLDNELALSPASRGFHVGLLIVIGLLTKPVVGYLSDRLGRKQVMVPGLVWSAAMALSLTVFDTGVALTAAIALLGLFLYPDQPVLTASVFDLVGPDVGSTALGLVSFSGGLMAAASPLIAGALYQGRGFGTVATYAAILFAASALTFGTMPVAEPAR
ncbi:MAG: MFS transporter [Acidimicrobiia bacterium]|nr:MFS transporter [Acidimicrobiia bacterium]